jgi:hypothetical protein
MLRKNLAQLALVVTDVEATTAVFANDFGLCRTGCSIDKNNRVIPAFSVGARVLALFASDNSLAAKIPVFLTKGLRHSYVAAQSALEGTA